MGGRNCFSTGSTGGWPLRRICGSRRAGRCGRVNTPGGALGQQAGWRPLSKRNQQAASLLSTQLACTTGERVRRGAALEQTHLGNDGTPIDGPPPRRALRALPQPPPAVRVLPLLINGSLEVSREAEVAHRIDRPAAAGPVVAAAAARPIRPLERPLPLLHASRCHGALTVMCFSRSHLKPSGVWSSLSITLDAIGPGCFVGDTSTDRWVARCKGGRAATHGGSCCSGSPFGGCRSHAALIGACAFLSAHKQTHRALTSAEPLPLSAQLAFAGVRRCFKA